jgi:hypothetical protein
MSSVEPPRLGQVVLQSLGATSEFRDPIIGDLAQEFASRHDRFGSRAARVWYYAELVRTAPHLVRNWWTVAKGAELRHLLAVIGYSYVLTLLAEFIALAVVFLVGTALGFEDAPLGIILVPVLVVLAPVFAGFTAASLYRKAPLIAATAFGFAISTMVLAFIVLQSTSDLPNPGIGAFRVTAGMLAPFASLYGGVIRLRAGDRFARWLVA